MLFVLLTKNHKFTLFVQSFNAQPRGCVAINRRCNLLQIQFEYRRIVMVRIVNLPLINLQTQNNM
jgi:hypothetical protein